MGLVWKWADSCEKNPSPLGGYARPPAGKRFPIEQPISELTRVWVVGVGPSRASAKSLVSLDNPPGPHNGLSWGAPSLASLPGGLAARMAERGSLGLGPEGCQGTEHPRVGWAHRFNIYLSKCDFGRESICMSAIVEPL